jgi:hypothetical protein
MHDPMFDDEIGRYWCPGCDAEFSPDEVREYIADTARRCGMQGSEGIGDADGHVWISANPDAIDLSEYPKLVLAFARAINSRPPEFRWYYLAWPGCPGRDWAEPPSLDCRERGSVRHCRESARFRRLRACMRAHPSDGPPVVSACIGSVPVIFP